MSKQAKVLFYEDDNECDMCDKHSTVVIIETLDGDGLCICMDCLKEIIEKGEKLNE